MTRINRPVSARWLWLLAVAMLLTQMLGMVHRVAHANRLAPQLAEHALMLTGHGMAAAEAVQPPAALAASGWLQRLFQTDGHGQACVLYDQIGHADGTAPVQAFWLPQVWVAAQPPWHACWYLAAQAAGFLARGPPQRV